MRHALFLFCLLALPARAEDVVHPPVRLIEAGVICALDPRGRALAPDTEAGEIALVDQTMGIDVETRRAPARLGLSFGWQLQLDEGAELADTWIVVRHPPLGLRGLTEQSWSTDLTDERIALDLFRFDYPHEMELGLWQLELHQGDRILARQSFEVVPEWQAPEVIEACYGAFIG